MAAEIFKKLRQIDSFEDLDAWIGSLRKSAPATLTKHRTSKGQTILHVLCDETAEHIVVDAVTAFLDLLGDPSNTQRISYTNELESKDSKQTALHYACWRSCPRLVRYLISVHADAFIQDAEGRTVHHVVANTGHEECLEALPQWSSKTVDKEGLTPLHTYAASGVNAPDCFRALMNHCSDLNAAVSITTNRNKATVAHLLAHEADEDDVLALLQEVLKVSPGLLTSCNVEGDTPLHVAIECGASEKWLDVVTDNKMLTTQLINSVTKDTLLHSAYRARNTKVIRVLESKVPELASKLNAAKQTPKDCNGEGAADGEEDDDDEDEIAEEDHTQSRQQAKAAGAAEQEEARARVAKAMAKKGGPVAGRHDEEAKKTPKVALCLAFVMLSGMIILPMLDFILKQFE